MGAAYKAVQMALGRTVALKVIWSEQSANEIFRALFHREAVTMGGLTHDNIVRVIDYGEEPLPPPAQPYPGLLWLALEFVDGEVKDRGSF
jgi:eukaryotic-like serine/threonine-protein kinase